MVYLLLLNFNHECNMYPGSYNTLFAVVISPRYRGKGLGRLVMDGCEQLAGEMGFSTAFLSTHDQQGFYGKLGYDFCEPICHYGSVAHRSTSSKVRCKAILAQGSFLRISSILLLAVTQQYGDKPFRLSPSYIHSGAITTDFG